MSVASEASAVTTTSHVMTLDAELVRPVEELLRLIRRKVVEVARFL